MITRHIILKNWRNFRSVDVDLGDRVFLVGPNASGKSNFLDVFRFLRDIAKPGGGLQKSIEERGGISKIRCFAARKNPIIEIEVHLSESSEKEPIWKYAIGLKQETSGYRNPYLHYEKVWIGNEQIVNRPTEEDKSDKLRLTQTYLEQINTNINFREISKFFSWKVILYYFLKSRNYLFMEQLFQNYLL